MAPTTTLAITKGVSPDFYLSAKERVGSSVDTSGDGAANDEDTNLPVGSSDLACKFSENKTSDNKYEYVSNHMYVHIFVYFLQRLCLIRRGCGEKH